MFELNPHSVHTLTKHKQGVYAVALDNLNIVYMMNEDKTNITIVKVIYQNNKKIDTEQVANSDKLRTREWLEKISEYIDFDEEDEPESEKKEEKVVVQDEEKKSHE